MQTYVYLFIMKGTDSGDVIDHINHSGHDNRSANLRMNSFSGNGHNCTKMKNAISHFYGVTFDKSRLKWVGRVGKNGKYLQVRMGTEVEAAIAYNHFAQHLYGGKANLNVIGAEDLAHYDPGVKYKLANRILKTKPDETLSSACF